MDTKVETLVEGVFQTVNFHNPTLIDKNDLKKIRAIFGRNIQIDLRVFSPLWANKLVIDKDMLEILNINADKPVIDVLTTESVENFYCACLCTYHYDKKFILKCLTPLEARLYIENRLALNEKKKKQLVCLGAPDHFSTLKSEFKHKRTPIVRSTQELQIMALLTALRSKYTNEYEKQQLMLFKNVVHHTLFTYKCDDLFLGDGFKGSGLNVLGKLTQHVLFELLLGEQIVLSVNFLGMPNSVCVCDC